MGIFSRKWCETVFEGKNKEFGAYSLRRDSDKRHRKALIIVVGTITVVSFTPMLVDRLIDSQMRDFAGVAALSDIKIEADDIPPMPEGPIEAEDVQQSADKGGKDQEKIDMTGSIKIESDGKLTDIGEGPETKEEEAADDLMAKDKKFSEKKDEAADDADDAAVTTPEDMPKFNGEDALSAFRAFVVKNLKYPEALEGIHVEGTVYVQFVIERNGQLSNIKILRGIHPIINNEVVKVIKSSPVWTPGKQKGKAVRVAYTFPIVFQFD